MFPPERDINNFPSCCHSRENNYLTIWHVSRHFFGDRSLSKFKFRNFNVQSNDNANHLINGCRANVLWLFTLQRDHVFSRIQLLAFKERDSCYINRALHMTSLTGNTLRIRFNSLRVRFFTKRLLMSTKREGSRGRWQRRRRVVCFTQNKGETKILITDVSQGTA